MDMEKSTKRQKHSNNKEDASENSRTNSKNESLKPPNGWDRCHAYISQKTRFCRQTKCSLAAHQVIDPSLTQTIYCGQHIDLLSSETNGVKEDGGGSNNKNKSIRGRRIPCPIDPSHTIYECNLSRHLRICPRAKQRNIEKESPYYRKNTNRGGYGDDLSHSAEESKLLAQSNCPELLVNSIFEVYKSLFMSKNVPNESITFEDIYNSIPMNDMHSKEEDNGLVTSIDENRIKMNGWKNRIQIGSILGNLHRGGCFQTSKEEESIVVLEMGAGRGIFGLLTAGRINSTEFQKNCKTTTTLILLDKSGSRHKSDGTITRVSKQKVASNNDNSNVNCKVNTNYLRFQNINTRRIKCDISHVSLQCVLKEQKCTALISIAKHLCGAGTDIALKSFTQITAHSKKSYYVFATCCHGLCTWEDYVGRTFLQNLFLKSSCNFVMNEKYFDILKRWACCAATCTATLPHDNKGNCETKNPTNEKDQDEEDHPGCSMNINIVDNNDIWNIQQVISHNELSCTKRGLGRMCQRLIDYGRMEYMEHVLKMSDVHVCHYVSDDITPQNALIVGSLP